MAKVVTVTQYEANDGSLFLSAAEADAHDFMLENKAEIDAATEAFVNTLGAIDRSRNMKINVASEFLAFYIPWVQAGKPVVERTVFDTPKAEAVEVSDEAKSEVADEVAPAAAEGETASAELF